MDLALESLSAMCGAPRSFACKWGSTAALSSAQRLGEWTSQTGCHEGAVCSDKSSGGDTNSRRQMEAEPGKENEKNPAAQRAYSGKEG